MMPAKTNYEILRLCFRQCEQGEAIKQVARDTQISTCTIYCAKISIKIYGSVFASRNLCSQKREIDNNVLSVS